MRLSEKQKSFLLSLLKFLAALAMLYFAFRKVNFADIVAHIKAIPAICLIMSLIVMNVAQIISSLRMRLYLNANDIEISKKYSLMLYYVGMFYNMVLPGGIGGDGYKVIVLSRKFHQKASKCLKVLILERINGMAGLIITMLVAGLFITYVADINSFMRVLCLVLLVLVAPVYLISTRILFKEDTRISLKALPYSLVIQTLFIVSALFLFLGLRADISKLAEYLATFQLASLLSAVIPISVGGVGVRELTFIEAAKHIETSPELGVAFAICFFAIYFISSLAGLIFIGKISAKQDKEGKEDGSTDNTRN